jgi:hypothetical protein
MSTDSTRPRNSADETTEEEVRGIIERARENGSEDIDMYERLVLTLAARVDDLEEFIEKETSRARSTNNYGIKRMNERMDEVESKMELLNAKKNLDLDVASELSVIELRLLQGHEFRRVDEQRAATLAVHYQDWATGERAGWKLSAKNANKFLSNEEDKKLDPTLAHRAIDELVEQAGGKLYVRKERGEKVLKMEAGTIWCPTEEDLVEASNSPN